MSQPQPTQHPILQSQTWKIFKYEYLDTAEDFVSQDLVLSSQELDEGLVSARDAIEQDLSYSVDDRRADVLDWFALRGWWGTICK